MKVFILLSLAVIASVSAAPVDPSPADKIQSEYDTFVKDTVGAKVTEIQGELSALVTGKVEPYTATFTDARAKFVDDLTALGEPTKALAARFDKDLKSTVDAIGKEFSGAALKKEIDAELNKAQSTILSATRGHVNNIKTAVKRTPASTKCWDAYKTGLEEKYGTFAAAFSTTSKDSFIDFDNVADVETAEIKRITEKYSSESKTLCEGKDAKCYNDYFNRQYSNIRNSITKSFSNLKASENLAVRNINTKATLARIQIEKDIKVLYVDLETCARNEDRIAAGEALKYRLNPTTKAPAATAATATP